MNNKIHRKIYFSVVDLTQARLQLASLSYMLINSICVHSVERTSWSGL